MSERGTQLHFATESQSEREATHTIFPGASIKVKTLTSDYYAWTMVVDAPFEVQIQSRKVEPHRERGMRFFIAKQEFTAYYQNHDRRVLYPAGTYLYAFPKPQDGLVVSIPGTRSK